MFGLRAIRSLTPLALRPTLAPRLRAMASIATPVDFNKDLYAPLSEVDPEVQNLIDKETWRQFSGLELIASEVCLHEGA
jgi:glycine hydroxymethyltransferase